MTSSPLSVLALAAALSLAVAGAGAGGAAAAQDAPKPKSNAQIDAGEPRATTSPAAAASDAVPDRPAAAPAPADDAGGAKRAAASKKPAVKPPGAADRVDLGTATVTGDREQPKVMYVVPWKSADIGDLSGKPMNSLIDEALAPVDRDEFKREVIYYNVMKADKARSVAPSAPAAQGEK